MFESRRSERVYVNGKRFGFQLFADEANEGLSIMVHPQNGTLRIGTTESPFAVADLPETEALELRIFVDKYVVEVFANERTRPNQSRIWPRRKT